MENKVIMSKPTKMLGVVMTQRKMAPGKPRSCHSNAAMRRHGQCVKPGL